MNASSGAITGAIDFCRVVEFKMAGSQTQHSHRPPRSSCAHAPGGCPCRCPPPAHLQKEPAPWAPPLGRVVPGPPRRPCSPFSLSLPAPRVVSLSRACPAPWTPQVCSAPADFLPSDHCRPCLPFLAEAYGLARAGDSGFHRVQDPKAASSVFSFFRPHH